MTARSVHPSDRELRAYRAHLANELRLLLREPAALIFGAILPLVAIIVMSAIPGAREPIAEMGGVSVVQTYLPVLVLFSGTMLGLTIIPGTLGAYRESGVLRRLRTTPTSPASLVAALVSIIGLAALTVALVLVAIPAVSGAGAPLRPTWFALVTIVSTFVFVAMGAALASIVPNAKAAPGIGNAIAAVMWAAAGLWFPRAHFPDWLRTIADLTPGGATAQAMMTTGEPGFAETWIPLLVLVAWGIVSVVVAAKTFRWE